MYTQQHLSGMAGVSLACDLAGLVRCCLTAPVICLWLHSDVFSAGHQTVIQPSGSSSSSSGPGVITGQELNFNVYAAFVTVPGGRQLHFFVFFFLNLCLCSDCATGACLLPSLSFFLLLTSILKPWMSGMPGSCDDWVALGNPGAFHSEQVTVLEVRRG